MTTAIRRTMLAASVAALALATAPRSSEGAAMHLRLTGSVPAKDSVVVAAPAVLRLSYSQVPNLKLSRVTLTGSAGAVTTGTMTLGTGADSTTLLVPVTGAMPTGSYTVSWLTASSDGHAIKGTFGFRVGAGE